MASKADYDSTQSNAYELFILFMTIFSLIIMVALLLPTLSKSTTQLLEIYDNAICILFLFDFGLRLKRAPSKRGYFIHGRGWLDLLGSIPSFSFFRYTALLRLARLSRVARISRLLRGKSKRELLKDVLDNRGRYAVFITLLAALVVLAVSAVMVLQFESKSSDANIKTGGQALWWAVVTITTVGYGDYYPVTPGGRLTATVVMFCGVGIIGSLASILASILVPPAPNETEAESPEAGVPAQAVAAQEPGAGPVAAELAAMRTELTAMRELLAQKSG
jgi:voltage-gated potassium channel